MVKFKKKKSVRDSFPTFSPIRLLAHPATIFLIATGCVIGGAIGLWTQHQDSILAQEKYRITVDKLNVSPQPAWISGDIKQAAWNGSGLDDLDLMDPKLVTKVAAAFEMQSSVRQVSVRKTSESVDVDIQYRQPVAMVEYGNNLLLPVDREGVVLDPGEFDKSLSDRFLRLSVLNPELGSLTSGSVWPDQRIIEAAAIADSIGPSFSELGIVRIYCHQRSNTRVYKLLSADGLQGPQVIWSIVGEPEQGNEIDATAKRQLLDDFTSSRGRLDQFKERLEIDIRSGVVEIRRLNN